MPDSETTSHGRGQGDEVRSNLAAVYARRAAALAKQGRFDDALTDFDKAIDAYDLLVLTQGHSELRGELAHTYALRGQLLRDRGRFEQALADMDAAVRLREKLIMVDPSASLREALAADLNIRGNILSDLGQLDDAVRDFETAIEIGESLLRLGPSGGTIPARRQLPAPSDPQHPLESRRHATSPMRPPIPLRDAPAQPRLTTSRADALREQRDQDREQMERERQAASVDAARNAEGRLTDAGASGADDAPELGALGSAYSSVAHSGGSPSPRASTREGTSGSETPPARSRPRNVVVRPVAKVEPAGQDVITYVPGVGPSDEPKAGRYVVIARDTGLGLVNKFWVTTDDIVREVETLRAGGVRIVKVVPVWNYYIKRVGLIAAAILLAASGTVIAMVVGRDGGSHTAPPDPGAAAATSAASKTTPPAPTDDATRAEMARAIGRKPPTAEEVSAEAARIRRETGIKGDPDSKRYQNSGEDEDIFDLLSPNYVPAEFKKTDK